VNFVRSPKKLRITILRGNSIELPGGVLRWRWHQPVLPQMGQERELHALASCSVQFIPFLYSDSTALFVNLTSLIFLPVLYPPHHMPYLSCHHRCICVYSIWTEYKPHNKIGLWWSRECDKSFDVFWETSWELTFEEKEREREAPWSVCFWLSLRGMEGFLSELIATTF
jgi:hypothetical protein